MLRNATCAAPQSGVPATTITWPVTHTSYATGSPPKTVTIAASTPPPITYTTMLSGSCSPGEVHFSGPTIWGTATQLTTITSTIVQTSTEYSVSHTSYFGPTIVSTLPGSTQVVTYTRPGETLVFTPPASLQTITWTTNGATVTQTQAASSITYTSIQAPSYYTVTTSIDALTLTTVLAAPTQVVTESVPGVNVTLTQTLPAETQYLTSITSIPAYTTTITQAASTQVLTSYQAASYYTVTTSIEAVTLTSVIPGPVQTIVNTQAASTQYITQTESQAASTFYETTTISLNAITRTITETSIGFSMSSLETTVTVTSYLFASTDTAISLVYATVTTTEIALGYQSTLITTLTETSYPFASTETSMSIEYATVTTTEIATAIPETLTTTLTETSYPFASTETSISIAYATVTATEIGVAYPETSTTTITFTSTQGASTEVFTAVATAFVTTVETLPVETTTLTVTSTEAASTLTETQTATTDTRTETETATRTETTTSDNISTTPAETSVIISTVTAFSTITGSASCDASSTTDNGSPPAYTGPSTTTFATSSESACVTPVGRFVVQVAGGATNIYLTGEDGGAAPAGDLDQRLVTTSDYANAVAFSAAPDGNGQITLISSVGNTLFSDQDSVLGSGDGPIYWDDVNNPAYDATNYNPVQFCLQPDDTFVVQNRMGTPDTADDANVVQICTNDGGALYLYTAAKATDPSCATVTLQLAQLPPGYAIPSTTTSSSTEPPTSTDLSSSTEVPSSTELSSTTSEATSTPTPTSPAPYTSPSACVPVPDGQQFRVSLVGSPEYLTGQDGGPSPSGDDAQSLITTTDYSQSIPFLAAPGTDGQITLVSAAGTTLYSNQDQGGVGDQQIFFDTMDTYVGSGYYPVQFCLQPDNTFVVQNLGVQSDSADDANVVQICQPGNAVYLYNADNAATSVNCRTVRLQIAEAPYVPPAGCPSTSVRIPDNQQFNVKSSLGDIWLSGTYGGSVPQDGNIQTTLNRANAIEFTVAPGNTGQISMVQYGNDGGTIDSQFVGFLSDNSGYIYFFNNQKTRWPPSQFCLQPDNTFFVTSAGGDGQGPSDATIVIICPNDQTQRVYLDNGNNLGYFNSIGCAQSTLLFDPVV